MSTDEIARQLTPGARRALVRMTSEWQTAKQGYFRPSGAHLLWCMFHRYNLCECKKVKPNPTADKRTQRNAYRLTPQGILVKDSLIRQNLAD